MYLVLEIFRDNLFALNQVETLFNSRFDVSWSCFTLFIINLFIYNYLKHIYLEMVYKILKTQQIVWKEKRKMAHAPPTESAITKIRLPALTLNLFFTTVIIL
jgi:hypothetical protein